MILCSVKMEVIMTFLRNYMYVFNITNVKVEVDVNPILEYEVKIWEEKTVNIPSFN